MIDLDVIEAEIDNTIRHYGGVALMQCSYVKDLITRLRQAEKDAARYRWFSNCYIGENSALGINRGGISCKQDFDAAIDEAMQHSGGDK